MGGWCQSFGALIVSRALMSSGFTAINAGDLCTMGFTLEDVPWAESNWTLGWL